MNFFKNKTVLITLGVVVVLAVLIGGWLLVVNKSNTQAADEDTVNEQVVEKLSPDEIGLKMEANDSNKAVKFTIAKASDIKSIEYQVTYEADSTAQEKSEGGEARVQRGITGDAAIKDGESSFESEWLDLGSCSKNICRYDTGVNSVMLTLKVTKNDGKVYAVEKTLSL